MILSHPLALTQLLSACICIESDEQIFFVKSLVNMHHFFLFFSHQRDCDIYRNILCNSKIFQGNLGKVPSNPTSSPSSQPPVGRLPRKRRSSSSIRKDFEAINMVENNWAVPQKDD